MKVCFLASGDGGNFKFLHFAAKSGLLNNIELSVIADRECDSIRYAKEHNICAKKINYKQYQNQELLNELRYLNPDLIITNWHKIIDKDVVSAYVGRLINLHYSLLPAFSGLIGMVPIQKAYEQNCQYIGTTCHYVDEGVDSGNIISQAIIKTNIPIEDAINEVFKKGCLILLNSLLMISDENILDVSINTNTRFDFSPTLLFDDDIFGAKFWKRLSIL